MYACAALRNAVGLVGGQRICLDCEKGSPNVEVAAAEKTSVDILIAPSMFGISVNLSGSGDFRVIEDLAQPIGAGFREADRIAR